MTLPTEQALPPDTRLNRDSLVLGQVLGRGGFGITYQAHPTKGTTQQGQAVAVKEFFPEGCLRSDCAVQFSAAMSGADQIRARENFLGEARVLSALNHPNIVRVETTFEENNTVYMVMEFLKGRTLEELIQQQGPLPEQRAISYIRQIGAALIEVHRSNFIHRDIKPENIIVCTEGNRLFSNKERVVLLDFGLNKELAPANTYHTMRMTNALRFGSPGYSPPEQYGRQAKFGPYTDVYSLGATLYYLLSAQMPAEAPMRMAEEMPSLRSFQPKITKSVEEAVKWALQLKGDERPQSVQEFLDALETKPTIAADTPTIKSAPVTGSSSGASTPAVVQTPARSTPVSQPSQPPAAPTQSPLPPAARSTPSALSTTSAPPRPSYPPPPLRQARAKTLLSTAKGKVLASAAQTRKRILRQLWLNFLDILPRLLLVAALIFCLWFFTKQKPKQPSLTKQGAGKSTATSSKNSRNRRRPRPDTPR